jgi:predicted  nucleic acid-binding Zn-ribbon protein
MKLEELQRQLNALEKEMTKLQSEITKAQAASTRMFEDIDAETTNLGELVRHLHEYTNFNADFDIRILGEYAYQGFFLGDSEECHWEIVKDKDLCWVLKLK